MNKDDDLSLAHPTIQALKAWWKKKPKGNYRRKYDPSFNVFFKLLKEGHGQGEIGRRMGLPRDLVRQLYNRYFKESFGNKSGLARQSDNVRRKRLARIKQSERTLLEDPMIRAIAVKARKAGCDVQTIPFLSDGKTADFRGRVRRKTLLINGYKCSLHHVKHAHRSTRRIYAQVTLKHVTACTMDVFIIHTALAGLPERIFVVPSPILKQVYFGQEHKRGKTIYLPMKKLRGYRNIHPLIDFWMYENAWHLLTPKPKT